MSAGLHYITIQYAQRAASLAALQVRWAGPGFEAKVIPVYGFPDDGPPCPNPQNKEGGPVNTKSGNYIYQVSDLRMQTLAGPLSFERTYSAQAVDIFGDDLLGYGWTHNHNRRLVFPDDPGGETDTVILRGADGSSLRFWQVELGAGQYRYEPRPEVRAEMVEIYDYEHEMHWYVITASDQSVLTFNEWQRFPVTRRDPQGNVLTYTYHSGWLSRVSDASGRYLEFDVEWVEGLGDDKDELWTGGNRLVEVSDHSGRTVRFGYHADSGDLAVATDTRGFAWTYVYSGATHWLREVRDPYGRVVEQNEYDGWGRVSEQSDGLGQKITFEYQVDTTSRTTVTFPLGRVLVDVYDSRNTLFRQERQGASENVSGYDGSFNRGSVTDARGNTTRYTWDEGGCNCNLDSVVDAQGRTTTFEYDGRNNLTQMVNAQGYTTTYEYDEHNNPITITDALGGMTVNRYDARGNLVQTTRNGAYTTTYAYDLFGQRVRVADGDDSPRSKAEGEGRVTRYGYDQLGRTVAVTTPQGITRYAYDAAGHTVAITRGYVLTKDEGRWTDAVFGERVTRYGFDAVGRQTRVTETVPLPGGGVEQRVTRTWYDAVGQVVRVTRNYRPGYPQNFRNQYNLTTHYHYDAAGNQVAVTDTPSMDSGQGLGRVNRTFYDAWNRPLTTVVNYVDGAYDPARPDEDILTLYSYDAVGNPVTTTDTLGRVTVKEYDELNRLVRSTVNYSTTRPNPDPSTYNLATTYEYPSTALRTGDALGNLVTTTNPLGRVTVNAYDALNRLVSATVNYSATREQNYQDQYNLVTTYGYDTAGNRVAVTDTLGHVTRYQYDELGRQVTTTNALSGVTWVEYDALGRRWKSHACTELDDDGGCVIRRTTVYTYDVAGRLAATEDAAGGVTRYSFDALGNTLVMTDAEGNTTRYAYDALNRLVTTTNALSGTTVIEYDALGRRVSEWANGRVSESANGRVTRYAYDGLGRTVAVTDALGNVTRYAYNGLGNRVAVNDPLTHTTVYTYDSLNRLIATANAEGNVTRYAYDSLGRRTVMTDAEKSVTRYEYDAVGRLAAVVENYNGGAQTDERDVRTTYGYDALGNRTRVTNALGHTSVYTYNALNRLVAEADPLGHITVYTYNILGQRSFVQDADGMVVSYTYDAAGRVAAIYYLTSSVLFDKAHDVQYAYDQVGNRTTMTDSLGTTTYTYDALYRLQAVKDPFGQIVRYTYDAAGNRSGLVYPDPSTSSGQSGKTVTYTHDLLNRLTIVEDLDSGLTRYGYDGAGRLVTTTLPNGVQSRYGYDDANRLTLIEHRDAQGDLLARYAYQLDGVGNRVLVTETLLTPGDYSPQSKAEGEGRGTTLTAGLSAGEVLEQVVGGRAPGNGGWAGWADLSGSLAAARGGDDEIITDDVAWYSDTVMMGNLLVTDSAVLTLAGASGTRLMVDDLTIASGARLVVSGAATITATNVTVEAGALLSSDGLGYGVSEGPGAGADGAEGLRQASGGGHGGWGGAGSDSHNWDNPYDVYLPLVLRDGSRAGSRVVVAGRAGGQPYDDASKPRMMGSGGGSVGAAPGGAGGGALRLMVDDTLILNGALSANGLVGDSSDFHAGGWGASGSLWIEVATCTGDGVLRADGGDGGGTSPDNAYGQGGGGAGGRVAVYASNNAFTSSGGAIAVAGGSGYEDGEAGSIYISVTAMSLVTVVADFAAAPVRGNAPLMVTFTNLSASSDEMESYQWDFGDGSTLLTTGGSTSMLENPTHIYTQTGSFTVTLAVTVGNEGDVEVKSGYISVTAESPVTVDGGLCSLTYQRQRTVDGDIHQPLYLFRRDQ